MIVCLCHRISDRDICREVEGGIRDFDTLQEETAIARNCGCCHDCAREVFDEACRVTQGQRSVVPIRIHAPQVAVA